MIFKKSKNKLLNKLYYNQLFKQLKMNLKIKSNKIFKNH